MDADHVSREEVRLIIDTVDERARATEQRLTSAIAALEQKFTVRMLYVVLGVNAASTLLSPTVAATAAAVGLGGIIALKGLKLALLYLSG